MSNTTYIRAAASMLPFIGPLIGAVNLHSVDNEIVSLQDKVTILVGGKTVFTASHQRGVDRRAEPEFIETYQKARLYAVAGLVGNIVTLIYRVRLYTLGVLPFIGTIPVWTGMAVFCAYTLYQYHTHLKSFEQLLQESPA